MAALATIDDYADLTGQALDDAETARVQRLLERASGAVAARAKRKHGQDLFQATYTAVTVYNRDGRFWLPQRPETALSSVTVKGVVLTEDDDYRWEPGGDGRPAVIIRRIGGFDRYWNACYPEATVTYTAGYVAGTGVPDALVGAVVAQAKWMYGESAMVVDDGLTAAGSVAPSYPAKNVAAFSLALHPAVKEAVDSVCSIDRACFVDMRGPV